MSIEKPIDRCVCTSKTFRELKLSGISTLDGLKDRFGCSTHCGLCSPFISKMLETGETEFAVISEDEPLSSEP